MIIVKFIGGLGNQMFQYAFYLSLKEKYDDVKADITDFFGYDRHNGYKIEDIFNLKIDKANFFEILNVREEHKNDIISKIKRKIFGIKKTHIKEKDFNYDILSKYNDLYLDGYWQDPKYFNDIEVKLREKLDFAKSLQGINLESSEKIKDCNSVSIHIRRGDYIGNNLYFECNSNYYNSAIDYLLNKYNKDLSFFVFSDNISWVKKNVNFNQDVTFINHNKGHNSYIDMKLMSMCRHNIIANSTFSWWGAWLNKNQNKNVIAPRKWFNNHKKEKKNNIVPNSWIRI